MRIKIKKLNKQAIIPTKGTDYSAGCDLYSLDTVDIFPHQTIMIHTGIALEIPEGYFGGIFARSGLATKKALRPANCVGVIDSDYRGEIMVALHNDSDIIRKIESNERVAQLIIIKHETIEFDEVNNLDETKRAEGGFGSTGE